MDTEKSNKPTKTNLPWLISFFGLFAYLLFVLPAYEILKRSDFADIVGVQEIIKGSLLAGLVMIAFVALSIFNIAVIKNNVYRWFAGIVGFMVFFSTIYSVFNDTYSIPVSISTCTDYPIIARSPSFISGGGQEIFVVKNNSYQRVGYGMYEAKQNSSNTSSANLLISTKPNELLIKQSFWQSEDFADLNSRYRGLPDQWTGIITETRPEYMYQGQLLVRQDYKDIYVKGEAIPVYKFGTYTSQNPVKSQSGFAKSDIFNPNSKIYLKDKEKLDNINYWQSKDFQKFIGCIDKTVLAKTYLSIG